MKDSAVQPLQGISKERELAEEAQFSLPLKKMGKKGELLVHPVCKPFVKWAGGKGSLLAELIKRAPQKFDKYFEPFVGGGALFFALRPRKAVLMDLNAELINTFRVVRDDVAGLTLDLKNHYYEKNYFQKVRDLDRSPAFVRLTDVEKASRFIFLNRTCFNGLYRVNSKGEFNVPFGRYSNPTILDANNLKACSRALQGIDILQGSFESILKRVHKNDFVYLDPPYAPVSETANFTAYTLDGFDDSKQVHLAELCKQLNKKGVRFMLSNAPTKAILKLYKSFNIDSVHAPRAINSKASKRGLVEELIIRNYR